MATVPSTPSVEHHSLHHAPILTSGVPTPAVLLDFEDACKDFFTNAKGGVNNNVKVIHILPNFKDPIIRGWISSDRPHLSTLMFGAFMKLLCSKFLSKQGEDEFLSKILQDHLRLGQDFLTWATKLQQQNCILRNTDSQLDEKRLREQISIGVDMDLRIAAREAKVNEATSLRDFLDIYTYVMRSDVLLRTGPILFSTNHTRRRTKRIVITRIREIVALQLLPLKLLVLFPPVLLNSRPSKSKFLKNVLGASNVVSSSNRRSTSPPILPRKHVNFHRATIIVPLPGNSLIKSKPYTRLERALP